MNNVKYFDHQLINNTALLEEHVFDGKRDYFGNAIIAGDVLLFLGIRCNGVEIVSLNSKYIESSLDNYEFESNFKIPIFHKINK